MLSQLDVLIAARMTRLVTAAAASSLSDTASFSIGNVIFSQDDPRFIGYESSYSRVLDIVKTESDYVGHDELFRIRETHPTPYTTNYARTRRVCRFWQRLKAIECMAIIFSFIRILVRTAG